MPHEMNLLNGKQSNLVTNAKISMNRSLNVVWSCARWFKRFAPTKFAKQVCSNFIGRWELELIWTFSTSCTFYHRHSFLSPGLLSLNFSSAEVPARSTIAKFPEIPSKCTIRLLAWKLKSNLPTAQPSSSHWILQFLLKHWKSNFHPSSTFRWIPCDWFVMEKFFSMAPPLKPTVTLLIWRFFDSHLMLVWFSLDASSILTWCLFDSHLMLIWCFPSFASHTTTHSPRQ